ncbi:MAG: carbohydrate-binding family 9-like protein [Prolixibacteraceae bacterium]|nr:carbohydrate-binding family 9-like protein [Prolixibacteraceae bacterium]
MKKIALISLLIWVQTGYFVARAQEIWKGYEHLFLPKRSYVVYQTLNDIQIDGKGDDISWKKAEWSADFADIEGDVKPKPLYPTQVKMLWNKEYLYILAELTEPHIWSYYKTRDQIVFHENDFEIFIDPDGDTHNYYEFELNAANTLFDLFLSRPYRNGCQPLISWNSEGFKSAVSIVGTLNNPLDVDQKWTVEMAIPFKSMNVEQITPAPVDGQIWKIDFSRVNWQTDVVDGKYQKKKDEKTGNALPEYNWVWSPTGEINMHTPERWGMLQFSGNSVKNQNVKFQMPIDEGLKSYLWLIYYKQHEFRRKHGSFSSSPSELLLPVVFKDSTGVSAKLELVASQNQFSAKLTTNNGLVLSLNESSLLQKSQLNKNHE